MSDNTVATRQRKRLRRMAAQGITRSTVIVHTDCRPALDALRPHFAHAQNAPILNTVVALIEKEITKPVNVAQVKQLSLFRYPGGKTWLVPEIRKWLNTLPYRPQRFVEPFAGGGIVGLTVAAENLADQVVLSEIDDAVASVWHTLINGSAADVDWLCQQILDFDMTLPNVSAILTASADTTTKRAFQTIIRNRVQRGGILAPGASLMKEGENGKGLKSRWYPETLVRRIMAIQHLRHRLIFRQEDAFAIIEEWGEDPRIAWFLDPPYTAGGKKAGQRLYTHPSINHSRLFASIMMTQGECLMTYDDAPEVHELVQQHSLVVERVPMKNTHHNILYELLITKAPRRAE